MVDSPSARAREQFDHPVIDADGHIREFLPAAMPYLRDALGPKLFESWRTAGTALRQARGQSTGMDERRRTRKPQSSFWATLSGDGIDRATAASPALLYERLDDLAMDYVVLYPTESFGVAGIADEDLRRGLCRGFNEFYATTPEPSPPRPPIPPLRRPPHHLGSHPHAHTGGGTGRARLGQAARLQGGVHPPRCAAAHLTAG